ncbi:MAG: hypothetical protein GY792_29150 [Gammaproteobacteria bacterium]|nr:hypothetical protein [Gammaproteobacteria bacterium]
MSIPGVAASLAKVSNAFIAVGRGALDDRPQLAESGRADLGDECRLTGFSRAEWNSTGDFWASLQYFS